MNKKGEELKKVKAFWLRVMEDEAEDLKHRLKASELLGKSLGAFEEEEGGSGVLIEVVFGEKDNN